MTDGASPSALAAAGTGAPRAQAFAADQDTARIIRQSLNDLGLEDAVISEGDVTTAAAKLAAQPSPLLLVVDIAGVKDPIARLRQLAEVCEPDTGVVAIGDCNDIVLYRELKRAGVSEYFFKPLVRDRLTDCFHEILAGEVDQPGAAKGKLIFVLGVRGGAGATTIAANIAWCQAELRQRWTMLVDLDLHYGDAALQLDATPNHALREALEVPQRIDKLFLERGVIRVTDRLNLLASLEPPGAVIKPTDSALGTLLENLLHRYRLVIADMPAATAACVPHILQLPGTILLTGNASLVCARDMARWRELLGPNTRERRTLMVLNRTTAHGGLNDAEFARVCGQPPDVVIRYDRELAEAANYGVQAMQKCAGFRQDLLRMLSDVTGEAIEKTPSLFSRIFGR